jgi:ATP-dependent Lhr-like helicase
LAPETVDTILQDLSSTGEIVKGQFRPVNEGQSPDETEWCYRPNLEKIHRQTISILRKEVTPSSLAEFTEFLFHWQGLSPGSQQRGIDGVQWCCGTLQGLPLYADIWERDILSRRVRDYSRENLSQLTSTGAILWVGAPSGRTMVIQRGEGAIFLSRPLGGPEPELREPASRVLRYLRENGASFFGDLRTGTKLSLHALNDGIAELFWSGLITNDVLHEVQNVKRMSRVDTPGLIEPVEILDPRHNPDRGRLMQTVRKAIRQVPGWTGRWSLLRLPAVMGEPLTLEEQAHHQAMQLLRRYGILAREFYRREELLPWALIAAELQRMEMRGEIRRGYFIQGLSGMQFALSAAVEEMRRIRTGGRGPEAPLLMNACDPANPYGPGIEPPGMSSPIEKTRITRAPSNYLVFHRGTPILMIENYGARMWRLAESSIDVILEGLRKFTAMMSLPHPMRPFKEIVIEHCDGKRPVQSSLGEALLSLGFRKDRNQTLRYDGYA